MVAVGIALERNGTRANVGTATKVERKKREVEFSRALNKIDTLKHLIASKFLYILY